MNVRNVMTEQRAGFPSVGRVAVFNQRCGACTRLSESEARQARAKPATRFIL